MKFSIDCRECKGRDFAFPFDAAVHESKNSRGKKKKKDGKKEERVCGQEEERKGGERSREKEREREKDGCVEAAALHLWSN